MDGIQMAGIIVNATLALLTAAYVYLTYQISRKSATSAQASLDAAIASQAAAEAAQKSALIAEAALPLSFKISPSRRHDGPVWFNVEVEGASVWLHSAKLCSGAIYETNKLPGRRIHAVELQAVKTSRFPMFLEMGGSGRSLEWPGPLYRLSDYGCSGTIELQYSYAETSEKQVRQVLFEQPSDLYDTFNSHHKLFPDALDRQISVEGPSKPGAIPSNDDA